jgi:hypothetical protein
VIFPKESTHRSEAGTVTVPMAVERNKKLPRGFLIVVPKMMTTAPAVEQNFKSNKRGWNFRHPRGNFVFHRPRSKYVWHTFGRKKQASGWFRPSG